MPADGPSCLMMKCSLRRYYPHQVPAKRLGFKLEAPLSCLRAHRRHPRFHFSALYCKAFAGFCQLEDFFGASRKKGRKRKVSTFHEMEIDICPCRQYTVL